MRYFKQKSDLLDFATHSDFVLDMRMAKSAGRVRTFLSDLDVKLRVLRDAELQLFLQYKKEDVSIVTCLEVFFSR